MELYSYYLFDPLDWEFCFLSVDEYKSKIRDNFYKNEATFCVILKCNDDGDTFVYSPVPLPYLEQNV